LRDDLAELMAASDCFILPHPDQPMEGFGIAVVEAQLAGLPLMLSTGIPDDPLLPTAHFVRLPVGDGPAAWARAVSDLLARSRPAHEARALACEALKTSQMDMDRALTGLCALHA
jgi:glycosyltransferase involved in cell wall biosynthesis